MRKFILPALLVAGLVQTASAQAEQQSAAEKFAIRIKGDIGLTGAYSTEYAFPVTDDSNSMNGLSLEFGWNFWQSGRHALQLGVGIGYQHAGFTAATGAVSYAYAAGPDADIDGNAYIRHTELSAMKQTVGINRISVPLYLRYDYTLHSRWSIYAQAGLRFGFGGKTAVSKISGTALSYGVYPEYDNLVIDDSWLNDFGETTLTKARCRDGVSGSAEVGVMAGAGISFRIIRNLSASVGLAYQTGFSDLLKNNGTVDASTAPVTYTVAGGTQCRPVTDGLTRCRLNRLSLELALTYTF